MSDFFDIGEEEASASSNSSAMQRMMRLANEIIELEELEEALEDQLKDLRTNLSKKQREELPELMAENGLSEFKTEDGHKISLNDFVSGSLPNDPVRRKEAIDWLSKNGGQDLIKNTVSVEFAKTEHNRAKSLAAELTEKGFFVDEKEMVHHSTLQAFAREKLHKGEDVQLETLGLYAGRLAKVSVPTTPRRKK